METEIIEGNPIVHFKGGGPVVVARPANPERALEIAREVGLGNSPDVQKRWDEMHERLNIECGPYTFVGFMGVMPRFTGPLKKFKQRKAQCPVLNEHGEKVDIVQPGDSFVDLSFFEQAKD